MTDIKPIAAEMLSDIAPIELAFPECGEELPLITLSDIDNSASVILSGEDRYSRISFQADIYADSYENVYALAGKVNSALASRGIKRTFSQLMTDEKYPRYCMRFSLGLDELEGRIVSL